MFELIIALQGAATRARKCIADSPQASGSTTRTLPSEIVDESELLANEVIQVRKGNYMTVLQDALEKLRKCCKGADGGCSWQIGFKRQGHQEHP
eukprot:6819220-Pyramimonas_sp.AAC.1